MDRSNDSFGRSTGYSLKDSGGTTSASSAYGYETTGRPSTITDGTDTDTFTYGYEADSNLLASLTAPQHTAAYIYESNRNVMTIIDNQASGSSLAKYAYTHDALGRRADRQQSGSAISTSIDDFAYNNRSEVTGSTNSVQTVAAYNPTYSFDQIGNRQSSTGTTVMNVDYDPFGNIISGSLVGEYGFSTKPLIDNLDWYYYGFRYYDPVTGRWPSRDPIQESGGLNLYAFIENEPVSYIDVAGLRATKLEIFTKKTEQRANIRKIQNTCNCECDSEGKWGNCRWEEVSNEIVAHVLIFKKLDKRTDWYNETKESEKAWFAYQLLKAQFPATAVTVPQFTVWKAKPFKSVHAKPEIKEIDPLIGYSDSGSEGCDIDSIGTSQVKCSAENLAAKPGKWKRGAITHDGFND
jgi:RHS repeat-associated protein